MKTNIIWNDWNREHIKKHNVSVIEVEKLVDSDFFNNPGHSGRNVLTARVGDRILTVVASFEDEGLYVVTARDASKEERRNYNRLAESRCGGRVRTD